MRNAVKYIVKARDYVQSAYCLDHKFRLNSMVLILTHGTTVTGSLALALCAYFDVVKSESVVISIE